MADMVSVAEKNNFPAVGLVDLGNMMGAFKFIDEVEKYNGNLKQKNRMPRPRKKNLIIMMK